MNLFSSLIEEQNCYFRSEVIKAEEEESSSESVVISVILRHGFKSTKQLKSDYRVRKEIHQ